MKIDIEDKDLEELKRRKMQQLESMNKQNIKIIVYRTPTCPYCHMVSEYLRMIGVPFTEVDVSTDHSAAVEMVMKSGQMGVPVIDINGAIIIGFDKNAIDRELSKIKRA